MSSVLFRYENVPAKAASEIREVVDCIHKASATSIGAMAKEDLFFGTTQHSLNEAYNKATSLNLRMKRMHPDDVERDRASKYASTVYVISPHRAP